MSILIARRPRGRMTGRGNLKYQEQRKAFCEAIVEIDRSLDFKIGARGWCYMLEEHGLTKGDFDLAERLISECRKSGELPLNICADDGARSFANLEHLDTATPEDMAVGEIDRLFRAHLAYQPNSFWETQPVYIEMLVEKIDLKSLFSPVCERYAVPLANARGSADINSRAAVMRRFAEHEAAGRHCVLLYCGDHDPAGLRISDFLRKNLADLAGAVQWSPDNLIVERFGLNADFIAQHGLTWIDNLETGSGGRLDNPKHKDFGKAYVQDYLGQFGARKVEANALVTRQEAGRSLCEEAILKYVDPAGIEAFSLNLAHAQEQAAEAIAARLGGIQ